jgi:PIN domain nuclease of toxin-antitoxin system
VKLLLDTHTFLWLVGGDQRLSPKALRRIRDVRNEKLLSIASVWEMAIKVGAGRLRLEVPLAEIIERGAVANGIGLLGIAKEHALAVIDLPTHHGDPFDRLLIAQALREDLTIVGSDAAFDDYAIRRVW